MGLMFMLYVLGQHRGLEEVSQSLPGSDAEVVFGRHLVVHSKRPCSGII